MSQGGPWSGRAFDQRAREAAREAAMAEGITLGEYLNRLLMQAEDPPPAPPQPMETPYSYTRRTAAPPPQPQHHAPAYDPATALDRLTRRIEATEARSTLAINGIDHTVLGLVARLQNAEQTTAAVAGHVEGLIEEMRVTHEALQSKVRRLEQDENGARNVEALKALEDALGKLASHVYAEGELTQNETAAIKGRVEAGFADMQERVEGMETRVDRTLSDAAARVERAVQQAELRAEGQTRQLADRLGTLETKVQEGLAQSGQAEARLTAVEADVSGALDSMESTLLRIQERLNRAETSTDTALKSLEQTFAHLDERIEAVAAQVDPEQAELLKKEFEQRFEDLARSVRQAVDTARIELATEITRAAEAQDERYAEEVGELKTRLAEVEAQGPGNVSAAVQEEIGKLGATVAERIDALATHVEERIEESELRNAEAIEQVGEQVTVAAVRLQKRQDEAITALAQDIDGMRKASDARLSDALAGVSERLEQMHAQSSESLSPVQRAIAALASRLENLEAFTTPPDVPVPPPVLQPEMATEAAHDPEPAEDVFAAVPDVEDEEFEAGFTGWEVVDEAEPESPYKADFDAIRAAASRIAPVSASAPAEAQARPAEPVSTYTVDVPDEDDLYAGPDTPEATPAPAAAHVEDTDDARGFDPVSELDGFDMLDDSFEHSHTETRESDIFDDEPDSALTAANSEETFSDALADEETSDYLARARRAALAAAEPAAARKKPAGPLAALPSAESPKSGVSKLPLYLAVSAVVFTGAGVGGYLFLRGKQPPQPAMSGPVDTYVDPQTGTPAATQVAEAAPPLDAELVLFEDEAAMVTADLFEEGAAAEAEAPGILVIAEAAAAASGASEPVEIATLTVAPADVAPAPEAAPSLKPKPVAAKPKAEAKPKPELTPEQAAIQTIVTAATAIEAGTPPSLKPERADTRAEPVKVAGRPDATFPRVPPVVNVETEANAGNAVAQYQLAQVLMKDGDVEAATSFLRRAAQKGVAPAQYDLGKLYERGHGVDRDLIEARSLIRKAAEAGHVGAMYDYALFLAEGEGGAKSEPEAVTWFNAAAKHGLLDAQYNLGVVHAEGIGTEKNLAEALFWFEVAAMAGDDGARQEVANLRKRVTMTESLDAHERAKSWKATPANGLANGKFGAQRWNTGNPLQVQAVQTALGRLGFDAGAPDGVVGPKTSEAIRDYQTMEGLTVTGTITPELVDHLNARAGGSSNS